MKQVLGSREKKMRNIQKSCWLAIGFMLAICAAQAQAGYTIGTWGTAPMAAPAGDAGKADVTLREIVHVSVRGSQQTYITLSNEFGADPLTIGEASIAHRTTADGVDKPVAVLFSGKPSIVIPPGGRVTSDMVNFKFPAMSDVVVSLFVPAQKMTTLTQHNFADATNYTAAGNQVSAPTLTDPKEFSNWRYLRSVEVGTAMGSSIVCLGDSITDGSKSTKDTNNRWPDLLAARLQANKATARLGVLNEGIGGNRVLNDNTGPSAIARLDRDVFNNKYAHYLIILEAINDIGHAYDVHKTYDVVTAADLIAGYHLIITRAHEHGMKVYGATLTPYVPASYSAPAGEKVREALNDWIRTTKELDGVIDFDKAARDPANPTQFLPAYDSGDHLHPNDAGMKAMAGSIDLKLFEK
jgi:lysophospholipase L1-like esterase